MPDSWFPLARRDGRNWTQYAMNGSGGSIRCGLHTTENSQSGSCDGVANYMWNNAGPGTGYSLLYHPSSGDFLQLRPFTVGAGSLKNLSGGVETNRNGRYNFQVSVVAYASEDWATRYPCPRWQDLVDWLRSWGVPDVMVSAPFCSGSCRMGSGTWTGSASGWYGHQHAPEQDHVDPGPRPLPWTIGATGEDDDMTEEQWNFIQGMNFKLDDLTAAVTEIKAATVAQRDTVFVDATARRTVDILAEDLADKNAT